MNDKPDDSERYSPPWDSSCVGGGDGGVDVGDLDARILERLVKLRLS